MDILDGYWDMAIMIPNYGEMGVDVVCLRACNRLSSVCNKLLFEIKFLIIKAKPINLPKIALAHQWH